MKLFKGLSLTALLIAGSMTFIAPTQATTQASLEAPLTEANITAPLTALTYEAPTVGTEAGTTQATTEALTQATDTTTQAPIADPTPAPIQTVQPAPAPTQETPTADPTPTTEAPTEAPATDPYSGNPYVDCAAQGMATAEDFTCVPTGYYDSADTYPAPAPSIPATGTDVPTAGAICLEDEPCWDCSTMGNKICGLNEAIALSGFADRAQFDRQYVGIWKGTGTARFGYRYVPSVINPEYTYVFVTTIEEDCANPATDPAWIAEWCPATK